MGSSVLLRPRRAAEQDNINVLRVPPAVGQYLADDGMECAGPITRRSANEDAPFGRSDTGHADEVGQGTCVEQVLLERCLILEFASCAGRELKEHFQPQPRQ